MLSFFFSNSSFFFKIGPFIACIRRAFGAVGALGKLGPLGFKLKVGGVGGVGG
jgi:hypothetical protein